MAIVHQTEAGYEIYFRDIEQLCLNSSSGHLTNAERQNLERRLRNLSNEQRKKIHTAMVIQGFKSHFEGDFEIGEQWYSVAAYFQKQYPVREFRSV